MSLKLDSPLDPSGDAYTEMRVAANFRFAVICRHRTLFTNSPRRFKRHYRAASRRGLAGTWFKRQNGIFVWWRIRLSEQAL